MTIAVDLGRKATKPTKISKTRNVSMLQSAVTVAKQRFISHNEQSQNWDTFIN